MYLKSIFIKDSSLRLFWNLLSYLIIVTATIAIIVIPIVLLLSFFNLSPQIGKPVTGWNSIIGSIITLVFGYFAFLLGTHLSQKFLRKSKLSNLGLKVDKKNITDLLLGIILGGVIIFVSIFLNWLFGWYKFTGFAWEYRSLNLLIPAVLLALTAKFQSALIEEVFFRGYLFQLLEDRYKIVIAVLISSFLFGLAHLTSMESYPWWAVIISSFLAGLLFAQAYLLNKNLWLPIGIHYGWLIFGRLLNDIGTSAEKSLLIISEVSGPELLTPGTAGGASLFELVGVGLVAVILWKLPDKN
jgi:membrane protease YdiL (CAAX protease family)